MSDSEQGFHWNTWFIGAEGFRESFNIEAADAYELTARRKAILDFMKEFGAVSDVRGSIFSDDKPKGPSKLDRFTANAAASKDAEDAKAAPAEAKLSPPTGDAEPMLRAAEAIGAVAPEDNDPNGAAPITDAHERLSKLSKYKLPKVSPVSLDAELAAQGSAVDALKPSKLARYAKPEKA